MAVLPFAAACGVGKSNETDREHATPWVAGTSKGGLSVRAVRVVPASPTTTTTGTTAPQAYLVEAVANSGGAPDQLTNATVEGATVQPSAGAVLTFPPSQLVWFGDPDLGDTGPALEVSGLSQPLRIGTTIKVSFQFQRAGLVTLDVDVSDPSLVGSTATASPIATSGSYPSPSSPPSTEPTQTP